MVFIKVTPFCWLQAIFLLWGSLYSQIPSEPYWLKSTFVRSKNKIVAQGHGSTENEAYSNAIADLQSQLSLLLGVITSSELTIRIKGSKKFVDREIDNLISFVASELPVSYKISNEYKTSFGVIEQKNVSPEVHHYLLVEVDIWKIERMLESIRSKFNQLLIDLKRMLSLSCSYKPFEIVDKVNDLYRFADYAKEIDKFNEEDYFLPDIYKYELRNIFNQFAVDYKTYDAIFNKSSNLKLHKIPFQILYCGNQLNVGNLSAESTNSDINVLVINNKGNGNYYLEYSGVKTKDNWIRILVRLYDQDVIFYDYFNKDILVRIVENDREESHYRKELIIEEKARTTVNNHPDMVLIKGGYFTIGGRYGERDEKPPTEVTISTFLMDKYEVTVGKYSKFLNSYGLNYYDSRMPTTIIDGNFVPNEDYDKLPISYVSWDAAKKYAEFVGKSLPTEAQWEYVATKCGEINPNRLSYNLYYRHYEITGSFLAEVGTYNYNCLGIADLIGNVWEWCLDSYYELAYTDFSSNPVDPSIINPDNLKVSRGGSYVNKPETGRPKNRNAFPIDFIDGHLGFRCVINFDEGGDR